MKRFNHKEVNKAVCNKFGLSCYKQGNFTHFKKEAEIGFIKQIGKSRNYLQTFLINFYSDDIVEFLVEQYKQQKNTIDQNKQGVNICLEQRGKNICKATLI